jgi:hypothetical protein
MLKHMKVPLMDRLVPTILKFGLVQLTMVVIVMAKLVQQTTLKFIPKYG